MEKRNQNTLARTLRCITIFAQFILIVSLFIPSLLIIERASWQVSSPQISSEPIQTAPLAEAPPPKDLVKIYSIIKANRPDISDDEAWDVSHVIRQQSRKHGLDPFLVMALIEVESGFQYNAVSPMGARGIMQIMPYVAQAIARESGVRLRPNVRRFMPEYLDDPIFNIKLGVYYLYNLKKSFRDLGTALIAYNMGPTELRNRMENNIGFSDEYSSIVLATYRKFKKIKAPTL